MEFPEEDSSISGPNSPSSTQQSASIVASSPAVPMLVSAAAEPISDPMHDQIDEQVMEQSSQILTSLVDQVVSNAEASPRSKESSPGTEGAVSLQDMEVEMISPFEEENAQKKAPMQSEEALKEDEVQSGGSPILKKSPILMITGDEDEDFSFTPDFSMLENDSESDEKNLKDDDEIQILEGDEGSAETVPETDSLEAIREQRLKLASDLTSDKLVEFENLIKKEKKLLSARKAMKKKVGETEKVVKNDSVAKETPKPIKKRPAAKERPKSSKRNKLSIETLNDEDSDAATADLSDDDEDIEEEEVAVSGEGKPPKGKKPVVADPTMTDDERKAVKELVAKSISEMQQLIPQNITNIIAQNKFPEVKNSWVWETELEILLSSKRTVHCCALRKINPAKIEEIEKDIVARGGPEEGFDHLRLPHWVIFVNEELNSLVENTDTPIVIAEGNHRSFVYTKNSQEFRQLANGKVKVRVVPLPSGVISDAVELLPKLCADFDHKSYYEKDDSLYPESLRQYALRTYTAAFQDIQLAKFADTEKMRLMGGKMLEAVKAHLIESKKFRTNPQTVDTTTMKKVIDKLVLQQEVPNEESHRYAAEMSILEKSLQPLIGYLATRAYPPPIVMSDAKHQSQLLRSLAYYSPLKCAELLSQIGLLRRKVKSEEMAKQLRAARNKAKRLYEEKIFTREQLAAREADAERKRMQRGGAARDDDEEVEELKDDDEENNNNFGSATPSLPPLESSFILLNETQVIDGVSDALLAKLLKAPLFVVLTTGGDLQDIRDSLELRKLHCIFSGAVQVDTTPTGVAQKKLNGVIASCQKGLYDKHGLGIERGKAFHKLSVICEKGGLSAHDIREEAPKKAPKNDDPKKTDVTKTPAAKKKRASKASTQSAHQ